MQILTCLLQLIFWLKVFLDSVLQASFQTYKDLNNLDNIPSFKEEPTYLSSVRCATICPPSLVILLNPCFETVELPRRLFP